MENLNVIQSIYYYEWAKKEAVVERNKQLLTEIKNIFKENRNQYGVRRVYRMLVNLGFHVNRKHVQHLMHENGLLGQVKKVKYKSYLGKVSNNVIDRNFKASNPFEKCATDVIQFNFLWVKCYLSSMIDMYTNEIIVYDISLYPNLS